MAVLKFRVYLEEDDSVYRDICIKHTQTFAELHYAILKAYEFDNKHQATFYRSNDKWLQGREISFEVYDKKYQAPPLLMADTAIGTEIINTNQKFVYEYDFAKGWLFLIELIHVSKETDASLTYPTTTRIDYWVINLPTSKKNMIYQKLRMDLVKKEMKKTAVAMMLMQMTTL